MYFIDIKGLKKDIREKRFTEKDRFSYIMLYIMIDITALELGNFFPFELVPTIFDYANAIISVLFTFLGTYFIYKANGGENGEDFAGKYFSITWVRCIQFLLIAIIIMIAFEVFNQLVLNLSSFNSQLAEFIFFSGYLFTVYLYSYRDILEIRE